MKKRKKEEEFCAVGWCMMAGVEQVRMEKACVLRMRERRGESSSPRERDPSNVCFVTMCESTNPLIEGRKEKEK